MKSQCIGILLALAVSSNAWACSCPLKTLDEHANGADAVHFATLQQAKVIPGEDGKRWPVIEGTFQVHKTLKGQAQSRPMILSTNASGSACGVTMIVGATYVLFKKKGQNGIDACDGSAVIDSFQEDEVAVKVRMLQAAKSKKSSKN